MSKQADLILYVFDGSTHLPEGSLMHWMEASSRFTDFVESYRDKIRKKIRVVRDPESFLDLLGELEVAFCLLNDRHFTVAYEQFASAKRRGPDFTVTYRTNLEFNIEVARIRAEPADLNREAERLLRLLLDKLGQMQPNMPNLLVIHTQEEMSRSLDLNTFMKTVKVKAQKKDPSLYAGIPYTDPASFFKDFSRLNGILLRAPNPQLWINRQARPSLDMKVMRRVLVLMNGE